MDAEALRRVRWMCRRGMLELDLILGQFVDRHYAQLSAQQREDFERLLQQDDPLLHAWFMCQAVAEDKQLAAMVEYILDADKD